MYQPVAGELISTPYTFTRVDGTQCFTIIGLVTCVHPLSYCVWFMDFDNVGQGSGCRGALSYKMHEGASFTRVDPWLYQDMQFDDLAKEAAELVALCTSLK